MFNGKVIIVHLIAGLIKKTQCNFIDCAYKNEQQNYATKTDIKKKEEKKVTEITLYENKNKHKRSSCTVYIVLFSIILAINIAIGTYFVYYKYMSCNKENVSKYDYTYQTTIQ